MPTTALEGLLEVDRQRRYSSRLGGFAIPAVHERSSSPEEGPFFVTNMRKAFVPTGIRPGSVVWMGFSPWTLSDEDEALATLYKSLWAFSTSQKWANRCSKVEEAIPQMSAMGLEARSIVVPLDTLQEVCGTEMSETDVRNLMFAQGYVAEVNGMKVFVSKSLPKDAAIVAALPSLVGSYVRADDSLALMIRRADKAIVLVGAGDELG